MARYKAIQSNPSAGNPTLAYTATGNVQVLSFYVCNTSTAATFSISIRVGGQGVDLKQYLFYETALDANETVNGSQAFLLAEGDEIYVWADTANIAFNFSVLEQ